MVRFDSSHELQTATQELKNVKRLIKYINGFSNAPIEHQERIGKNIAYLKRKVQTDNIKELNDLKVELENKIECLTKLESELPYLQHLKRWYFRPLLNHFDNVQKINTLTDKVEGAPALKNKLHLFIPDMVLDLHPDRNKTVEDLHHHFKFKAKGKNTPESDSLEQQFYKQFEFTEVNPFPNTALGSFGLPVIWYNVPKFFNGLKAGAESVLISGLCPLSTITNEIGLKLTNDRIVRPTLGFDPLDIDIGPENIKEIIWPGRPIISDYIMIKTILELYSNLKDTANLSVNLWYPYYEYYLDLTQNIFYDHLQNGSMRHEQIKNGLDELKTRYFKLIEFVKTELDLNDKSGEKDINIIIVDEKEYLRLEQYKKQVDLSFFKYIYGSWVGNELRRRLYEQLIIKHIKPIFEGKNVLHLDSSYEFWVDLLATRAVEHSELKGSFSWLSYPTIPSISLSNMREYNARHNDKLYLTADPKQFQDKLEKVPKKYLGRLAPLVLNYEYISTNDKTEMCIEVKEKLLKLNDYLQL